MGNLKLALFLALKSIVKGNRWALASIIIVMSLSFVNLIFTSSILSGVTHALNQQLISNQLSNVVISPAPSKYYLEGVNQLENSIKNIQGVAAISAQLKNSAFFEYQWKDKASPLDKGKSGSWEVTGIDPQKETLVTSVYQSMVVGTYLQPDDRDSIILGVDIAGGSLSQDASFTNLGGVQIGDKVRLTYNNGPQREYTVRGIFRSRSAEIDRSAFITRKEMAAVLDRSVFTDRASRLLVKLDTTGSESVFIDNFKALGIDAQAHSWEEYGGMIRGIGSSFGIVASLISGIGLIVAAVVMYIVIYVSVASRRRQIGVLRAIGIKARTVIGSYLIQALFYAVVGVIIGYCLMHFIVQPYYSRHPLDLSMGLISLVVEPYTLYIAISGILIAAVMAGWIPAMHITRQSIIKAIWGA